jgi:hypothetical protein
MLKAGTCLVDATCRSKSTPRLTKLTSKLCTAMAATQHSGVRSVCSTTRSTSTVMRSTRTLVPFASTPTFPKSGTTLALCTSRATTRPATRSMRTLALLTLIPQTSISRHAWRCSKGSPPMACLIRLARLCRKMSTLRRINRAHLVVLQVSHGEHRRTTARLLGQRHHLLLLATTGEATGSQNSRTPQDHRSLSTPMTLATVCHSRSHPWHRVDLARLDRTRSALTRSLSVLHHPLTAVCLLRPRTSNLRRSSLRRRTCHHNIPLLAHRKAHRSSSSSSSLLTKASHCLAREAVLHPTVFSHRRATLQSLASTVSQALARKLGLLSTTLRLRRVVRSLAHLTSTMRTRACRRLQAARRHHQTHNLQLMPPHVTERRGLAALHQSAFANGKTITASRGLRPRTHALDSMKSRCNAPLRSPSKCLLRPIAALQR